MIIYASFTETSTVKLFMAGVVPGLLLTLMFMFYIGVHSVIQKDIAPKERGVDSLLDLLRALADILPFLILIVGTVGGMFAGFLSPTEAGAVGYIWGDLNWPRFIAAVRSSIRMLGNLLFIVYAAFLFSYAISITRIGDEVTSFVVDLGLGRLGFIFALFVLYSILGCLIEGIGILVITTPLIFPILAHYGINPIWFGVILVVFIEMGLISPPIGINLFVIQSTWKGKLVDVVLGTIPFHLIMIVLLMMLVLWPELALWLPTTISSPRG
jgi:tripartite ATP-independent transporter DctM subunit